MRKVYNYITVFILLFSFAQVLYVNHIDKLSKQYENSYKEYNNVTTELKKESKEESKCNFFKIIMIEDNNNINISKFHSDYKRTMSMELNFKGNADEFEKTIKKLNKDYGSNIKSISVKSLKEENIDSIICLEFKN